MVAEHLEFLGDGLLLHARHEPDGTPLILRLPKEERGSVAAGQRLHLRFPPARALLFGPGDRRAPARAVAAPAADALAAA